LLLNCRPQFVDLPLKPRNPLELLVLLAAHLNQEVFHPRQSFRDWLNDGGQNLWNSRATGFVLRWHSVDPPLACWESAARAIGIYRPRRKKATSAGTARSGDVVVMSAVSVGLLRHTQQDRHGGFEIAERRDQRFTPPFWIYITASHASPWEKIVSPCL
jgi:hypothetical protein